MLKLTIVLSEDFDNQKDEFVEETIDVELEHSLASLSKWEEKWEIPLLSTNDKTAEQNLSYMMCMCLTPNVAPEVFNHLSGEQAADLYAYIEGKHTATWFSNENKQRSGRVITAELIYYWMSSFQIDWQAQYWNLNRLLTLIKVFGAEQDQKTPKQRTRSRMADMASLNAKRRAELGSTG